MSTLQVANIVFESTANNRIQYLSGNNLTLSTAGSERMRVDGGGNVGIGTSTPFGKLDVNGSIIRLIGTTPTNILLDSSASANNAYTGVVGRDSGNTSQWFVGKPDTSGSIAFLSYISGANMVLQTTGGGSVIVTGTGTLGYGTGAGGYVTQTSSKSTAVTLNKPTGQISMNAGSLAAGANVAFLFNNSTIGGGDTMVINYTSNGTGASYRIEVINTAVGGANIRVTNIGAGALAEGIILNYTVIKGANN